MPLYIMVHITQKKQYTLLILNCVLSCLILRSDNPLRFQKLLFLQGLYQNNRPAFLKDLNNKNISTTVLMVLETSGHTCTLKANGGYSKTFQKKTQQKLTLNGNLIKKPFRSPKKKTKTPLPPLFPPGPPRNIPTPPKRSLPSAPSPRSSSRPRPWAESPRAACSRSLPLGLQMPLVPQFP